MKTPGERVYVIESVPQVRESIQNALAPDFDVQSFQRAADYVDHTRADTGACLIIDMEIEDINGLELLRQLDPREAPPIIFISDCPSAQSTIAAMKAGAFEFLIQPFRTDELRAAVEAALQRDRALRQRRSSRARLEKRFSSLTPRQREVFPLIIAGLLNKQAAALLNISEVTLQIHRSQIMRKMRADSVADLVRMAVELGIPHWRQRDDADGPGGRVTREEKISRAFSSAVGSSMGFRRQPKAAPVRGNHLALEFGW